MTEAVRSVGQAFLSAGSSDFPVAGSSHRGWKATALAGGKACPTYEVAEIPFVGLANEGGKGSCCWHHSRANTTS
jgi:hypothetical protein